MPGGVSVRDVDVSVVYGKSLPVAEQDAIRRSTSSSFENKRVATAKWKEKRTGEPEIDRELMLTENCDRYRRRSSSMPTRPS